MTNMQIIAGEVMLRGITEEVDTYAGWLRRGMQVAQGQKALFTTKIWKPCKSKNDEEETNMYLVKAAFFGLHQVAAKEARA